jgi:hypothetical protein
MSLNFPQKISGHCSIGCTVDSNSPPMPKEEPEAVKIFCELQRELALSENDATTWKYAVTGARR